MPCLDGREWMSEQASVSNAAAARILCEMLKISRADCDEEIPPPVLHWFLLHRVLDLIIAESSEAPVATRREITSDILWARALLQMPHNAAHHATSLTIAHAFKELRERPRNSHIINDSAFLYGQEWAKWLS